ncbi:unnamed protein product [Caenorhabditis brenneri]
MGGKALRRFEEPDFMDRLCKPAFNIKILQWIMATVTAYNLLDLNDKEIVNEYLKGCDSFERCRPHLQCNQENYVLEAEALISTPPVCDAVRNFSIQFSDCWTKISEKQLSSVAMWTYYRNEKFSGERILLLENDTCQMFFGKTGWIKKVIRDTCGEEKWEEVSSGNNLLAFGCDMGGLGPNS